MLSKDFSELGITEFEIMAINIEGKDIAKNLFAIGRVKYNFTNHQFKIFIQK